MNSERFASTRNMLDEYPMHPLHSHVHPNFANNYKSDSLQTHKNSLLASANKLLSEIIHLKYKKNCDDVSCYRNYLLSEIQKFQIRAETMQYDTESILISRYILSATIDEMIDKTEWGTQANWKQQSLLQELQHNTNADEHFFTLLEKLCRAPNKFIDNIELIYISLTLGFEGKFRNQPHQHSQLQKIINDTYQIIRAYRGEIDKRLSPTTKATKHLRKKKIKYTSIWTIIFITIATIIGTYATYDYLLNKEVKKFSQQIQTSYDQINFSSKHSHMGKNLTRATGLSQK